MFENTLRSTAEWSLLALPLPGVGFAAAGERALLSDATGTFLTRSIESELGLAADSGALFSRGLGSEGPRATTELLDAMRDHGRTIRIVGEGSDELRYLNAMNAEANVGGAGHLDIILRENPSRAAAMEEFLHGTQDRLGIIDRLGTQGAEDHVADFMARHRRLLGLEQ